MHVHHPEQAIRVDIHLLLPKITYLLQAGGATVYFGGDTLLIPVVDTLILKYAGKPSELTQQFQQATAALSPATSVRVLATGEPLVITV